MVVGGDGEPFQHAVGVRFQNEAVHERAGVTFVTVADDVLRLARLRPREWTILRPVGKPAPPRPRRPDARIASIVSSGDSPPVRQRRRAWYPSRAR